MIKHWNFKVEKLFILCHLYCDQEVMALGLPLGLIILGNSIV